MCGFLDVWMIRVAQQQKHHSGTTTQKEKQGKKTLTNNRQNGTIVENVNTWQKESVQVRGKCSIKREERRVRGGEFLRKTVGSSN